MARTLDSLRRGARIHTLFYASFIARNTDRLYDVVWQELGYRRTAKEGAHGIVVFGKAGAVGAFFEPATVAAASAAKKKRRTTKLSASGLAEHMKGMPSVLQTVAKREVFPAMSLDSDDPAITAMFWAEPKGEGELVGARPWAQLAADGAHLAAAETLEPRACVRALAERYAFDDARATVIGDVFASKAALDQPSNARVTLSADARQALGLLPNQATRELLQGAAIELA